MNPYDFVRVDWSRKPIRLPAITHNRFEGLSGHIEGTLTALTPIFLPGKHPDGRVITNREGPQFSQSLRNGQVVYFIGGSSLKGLIRSVVETVTQSCFHSFSGNYGQDDYARYLPSEFFPCNSLSALCTACRLFGIIRGRTVKLGRVNFGDAICTNAVKYKAIYTQILSSPKPHHRAFYINDKKIAGRKFYFHHNEDNLLTATGWLPVGCQPDKRQNQLIQPLAAESCFSFSAEFVNLSENDLAALLYAFSLENEIRHKLGYAKSCGLGSIHIQLNKLALRNYTNRYRQETSITEYEGEALSEKINQYITAFIKQIPAITLVDLRRIWQWPPPKGVTYHYPTQNQFKAHPNDPISSTDTW